MGRMDVKQDSAAADMRAFTKALLEDLHALERMLEGGCIEAGVRRIGAEQELFLVDAGWRPAPVAMELLESLTDAPFTTELVRFQLEINDAPIELSGRCLSRLEDRLSAHIEAVRREARRHRAEVVLVGILPTATISDLSLDNMAPKERYYALNEVLSSLCGGSYRFHIQGADELNLEFDSVMLEGCNSSFQVHLQVEAEEFARVYNAAQLVTAPVLAASVCSPLLFGKRLWSETRISLFQQSIDTRGASRHLRELAPRVRFGERWVESSVLDVYREDVARFPALLMSTVSESSLERLERGEIPGLQALQLYNGTVYRWNRPCFGVTDGKPHLRIECRVLPSGPSLVDEVANAALWVGATLGAAEHYPDLRHRMEFSEARSNLLSAARRGLRTGFAWLDGRSASAETLILNEILPLARLGLATAGVAESDIERYLGIVEGRVESGQTGAEWLQSSYVSLDGTTTAPEKLTILTAELVRNQEGGKPCHEWRPASAEAVGDWNANYRRVEHYMTTDLYTLKEAEPVDLAALVMDWRRIRQLPVEDDQRRLVGMVSFPSVLRCLGGSERGLERNATVRDVMMPEPPCVEPETQTVEALRLMRRHGVTNLPVVKNGELVGIISLTDFLPIAERLLSEPVDEEESE